jgi:hypothetical protein
MSLPLRLKRLSEDFEAELGSSAPTAPSKVRLPVALRGKEEPRENTDRIDRK